MPELRERPKRLHPRAGARQLLALLSRKRSLYTTRRLVEAIKERGHRAIVLDTLRCNIILGNEEARMTYRGVEVRNVDVVIPRIGASITEYGLAVVNHLDMMGIPVLNGAAPIGRSRDKLRCLQLLSRFGIDIPRTVMAGDRREVEKLVEEVGGLPAIIKLLRGTQGVGVLLVSSLAELQTGLNTFWDLGVPIVLQEFIRESKGQDIRALVVGDRVIAAMRRRATPGEFRSNLHRGGKGVRIELPKAYAEAAVSAARIVGLEVGGVDMLESTSGPKIMEVNSSPGFRGLEDATRQDIAGLIVDHAIAFANSQRTARAARRSI